MVVVDGDAAFRKSDINVAQSCCQLGKNRTNPPTVPHRTVWYLAKYTGDIIESGRRRMIQGNYTDIGY